MKENDVSTSCEADCDYFRVLSPTDQPLNRRARETIIKGKELPGSLSTMCGSCVRLKTNTSDLNQRITLLIRNSQERSQG